MTTPNTVGPVLYARRSDRSLFHLSALVLVPPGDPPRLCAMEGAALSPLKLAAIGDRVVWRYDFTLPATDRAFYRLGNIRYRVAADLAEDARIAYVSCNGQAHADGERSLDERNRMWRRLAADHDRSAISMMLHGGDQLYADEVVNAHPVLTAWSRSDDRGKAGFDFTEEVEAAAEAYLFQRYADLYAQPAVAHLLARVPSLMMWDDHDIIDGWGSHSEALLDSAVGQGLFRVARCMFKLFQRGATDDHPADTLQNGTDSLSFTASFPGFEIIVPDLRSERRPGRVMGPEGWLVVSRALARSDARRQFLMSSVPLLGPRLSWIEALIGYVPRLRRYEDDLRDQWQSRFHREEWKRFLLLLERTLAARGSDLTVLSGEIHLATRAEMRLNGAALLNQLVTSGIAHQPPPAIYARALGWLAALGEDPLPGRPIRMRPLPGRRSIYTAERGYLVLERQGARWTAFWELEESGRTPSIQI